MDEITALDSDSLLFVLVFKLLERDFFRGRSVDLVHGAFQKQYIFEETLSVLIDNCGIPPDGLIGFQGGHNPFCFLSGEPTGFRDLVDTIF